MEGDNNQRCLDTNAKPICLVPSDVVKVFNAGFLDEAACRQFILSTLHPKGARCPRCNAPLSERRTAAFWTGQRVKCGHCRKEFTGLTGTFLIGCHWDFTQIFLLFVLIGLGLKDPQIASILDCRVETVKKWRGIL